MSRYSDDIRKLIEIIRSLQSSEEQTSNLLASNLKPRLSHGAHGVSPIGSRAPAPVTIRILSESKI